MEGGKVEKGRGKEKDIDGKERGKGEMRKRDRVLG